MLNKKALLLSLLLFSPLLPQQLQTKVETEQSELQKWGNFSLHYIKQLPPLAISATIGIITGGICAHALAKKGDYGPMDLSLQLIFAWLIESTIRTAAVEQTDTDLDRQSIKHDKKLMLATASLASWLTYLKISGYLPFIEIDFKR